LPPQASRLRAGWAGGLLASAVELARVGKGDR